MRVSLVVAALVLATPAAPAFAADLNIEERTTADGDPSISVFDSDRTGGTIEWRRCAADGSACVSLGVPSAENPGTLLPGETPAGSLFEAVHTAPDGAVTTARTVLWKGRIAATAVPVLGGEAKVGATVTASPSAWAGGWEMFGRTYTGIVACREPNRNDCHAIAYGHTVTIDPRWAGWYLTATASFDTQRNPPVAALAALPAPIRGPLEPSAHSVLSAPVGPVAGLPPESPRPVAEPTASIRSRALRRNGHLLVGRVRCEVSCKVKVKLSGGGRRAVTRTFTVQGAKALELPVRRGRLQVRIDVDGKLVASGRTTYPRAR